MLISSLMPEELPLGTMIGGGGVRVLSSSEFRKSDPPELGITWLVNALKEGRRLAVSSLVLIIRSSGM